LIPSKRILVVPASVLALAALGGCGSTPLAVEGERTIRFEIGLRDADFPVYCLSRSSRLHIGKFETTSDVDPGRTVLYSLDAKGNIESQVTFPADTFAVAVHVEADGSIFAVAEHTDPIRKWRVLRLTPAGLVVWDRPIARLDEEGFHLAFDLGDWTDVRIVSGPGKDELSFLWYRTESRPEMGLISFRISDGAITRVEDGVRSLAGPLYEVDPSGIYRIQKNSSPTPLLQFGDRPWALDAYRGRLLIQVSDDGGKTGEVYHLEKGEVVELIPDRVRFPIRWGGSCLYALDPAREVVHIYPLSRN
jgi:hypothetical protein